MLCNRRMSPAYWQMGCILAIAPLGTTFLDNAALVTCAKNFPSQRGTAIGLVKAAFGGCARVQLHCRLRDVATA